MEFDSVRAFDISLGWLQEGRSLYEAFLEEMDHRWVLVGDDSLAPKEPEQPAKTKANLLVLLQWSRQRVGLMG